MSCLFEWNIFFYLGAWSYLVFFQVNNLKRTTIGWPVKHTKFEWRFARGPMVVLHRVLAGLFGLKLMKLWIETNVVYINLAHQIEISVVFTHDSISHNRTSQW